MLCVEFVGKVCRFLERIRVLACIYSFSVFARFFLYNFIHSMFYGKPTVQNPWKSNTLEWTAPIKHFHGNWEEDIPEVHRWAYDYSKPGHEEDYVPQHIPLKKGEKELQH